MSPERMALKQAIDVHRADVEVAEQARQTLQKAQNLLCALQAQAADFASLDNEIAAARAEQIKRTLTCEDYHMPLDAEPEGFAARKIARDRIASELAAVQSAIVKLEAELADAERCVEQRRMEIELAAEAVIVAEAERLAIGFLDRLAELRREYYVLNGLADKYLVIDGGVRKVKTPPVVGKAVTESAILGMSETSGGMRVRDAVAQETLRYWNALKTDASAALGDDPSPDEPHRSSKQGDARISALKPCRIA